MVLLPSEERKAFVLHKQFEKFTQQPNRLSLPLLVVVASSFNPPHSATKGYGLIVHEDEAHDREFNCVLRKRRIMKSIKSKGLTPQMKSKLCA